jgi:16S rRNA processing protein RimM
VQNFGAGDLLELRLTGARHTELLPFTDAFVPAVDVAGRRVTVVLPVFTEADLDDGEEPTPDASRT